MKKQKDGITLVALIITIIVLIILAAVTILAVQNTNLVERTQNATIAYEMSQREEKQELDDIDERLDKVINQLQVTGNGNLPNDPASVYNALYAGDYVKLKYKEDETIASIGLAVEGSEKEVTCIVLYDKEYNEQNDKDYGIQILAMEDLGEVTLGYEDPRIQTDAPDEVKSGDNYTKALWSWNHLTETLNKSVQKYKSDYITGVRSYCTVPDNPNEGICYIGANDLSADEWLNEKLKSNYTALAGFVPEDYKQLAYFRGVFGGGLSLAL